MGITNEEAIEVLKNDIEICTIQQQQACEMAIKVLEQQPCEERIRELIKEFDNNHPALFADYMREFNNHPISEIIDYMWDMHDLIEDIRYRLPNEGGEKE